ncbi:MAG: transposase [Acetatifactor sp.]|nr:transposase [Acetatifactor sp.]
MFIVDNLKVHHEKIVNEWLDSHKDEIEIFYTSPYSPEINPDEYLNHNLKQNIHSGIIPHTKVQNQQKTEAYMHRLQEHKERVASLFKHRKLNYIEKYGC